MKIKVSLIIPNFNGQKLLAKNLPAVLEACQSWKKDSPLADGWEVVVIDDASTDDSVSFLKKEFPEIKIARHKKNQRFAAACNSGVKAARGEIIVLLNNDVFPEPDFLKPLLVNFSDPQVFAVGCRQKEERGGEIFYSGRGVMCFKRGLVVHWRAEDQNQRKTDWAFGGAAAFDRKKWLEIGGMDTLFRPAYEEDRDLSYRALKHGWKVFFEPKSVVSHTRETTNIKVFGKNKMATVSFKNQFLFVWKNITDPDFLLKHFLWLPYHLVFTNLKTRGLLGIGFLLALRQIPELLKSRERVRKLFVKKDKELV